MDTLQKGWFTEASDDFPGQAFSLKIKEVLFDRKSAYQHVLVFQSESYGRVLVLDGRIQLTERDEAFYQEMISLLPLNVHPCPRRVLIIGGGDGGVARECARHSCVEHVDLVDIDEVVLEASRQFLPFTASGLSHPKVVVHVEDGFQFLKKAQTHKYDVVITDSTDPGGPSTPLFDEKYFRLVSDVLNEDGIMCSQGENLLLDLNVIQNMLKFCGKVFPTVGYAYNTVPTYTSGHIGYVIASKVPGVNLREPIHRPPEGCKFYTEEVHRAAFALPACYAKVLGLLLKPS
uniref:Spermidine synthase n=2 Tax=Schistocephalus solidus TaxID=70667 RepID=A0A0X3NVS2_SCHSO